MARLRPLLLAGALFALTSCQDHQEAVAPLHPEIGAQLAISDGAHSNGNNHFYFLPPTVPSRPSFSGTFDASALPSLSVEVCELSGSACAGPALATMTSTTEPYQAQIRADAVRQHFLVYWNTADKSISTAKTYRASVFASGQRLGYIDVAVVAKQKDLDKLDRSKLAGVIKGEWLQLVFRVEQGATQVNQPPTLRISDPANDASFPAGSAITFAATASDAEDGDLSGKIVWTADGTTPLGTGASVSTAALGVGTHTVRASVSDAGGATAEQEVRVTVTNTPPVLKITTPPGGSSFGAGVKITFTATVADAESGDLSEQVTWTSSVSGPLGTGASVSSSTLSAGTHKIIAQVIDPHGAAGKDSIQIIISSQAPSITITAPASGSSFPVGSTVAFKAMATDPVDGDLTSNIVWMADGATPLGTGGSVSTSALGLGAHTITAAVTNQSSLQSSASVSITVTNTPPVVKITAPPGGSSFDAGGEDHLQRDRDGRGER